MAFGAETLSQLSSIRSCDGMFFGVQACRPPAIRACHIERNYDYYYYYIFLDHIGGGLDCVFMNLTRWIDVAGRDTNMHEVHGVWGREEGGSVYACCCRP